MPQSPPEPRCAGVPLLLLWLLLHAALLLPLFSGELDTMIVTAGVGLGVGLAWPVLFLVVESVMATRDRSRGAWPYAPWTRWALIAGYAVPLFANALDPIVTFPWLVFCGFGFVPGTVLTGPFNLVQVAVLVVAWPAVFWIWRSGLRFDQAARLTAWSHLALFVASSLISALPMVFYALYPAVLVGSTVRDGGGEIAGFGAGTVTWAVTAAVAPFLVNLDAALPALAWAIAARRR